MLSPKGRVIMVSGANRGIGLATANCLASQGYQLILGARQPDQILDLENATGHMTHHWDAEKQDTSAAWVEATLAQLGRIDGLVLNAGVALGGSLESGTEEDIDRMFAVNIHTPHDEELMKEYTQLLTLVEKKVVSHAPSLP